MFCLDKKRKGCKLGFLNGYIFMRDGGSICLFSSEGFLYKYFCEILVYLFFFFECICLK